MCDSSIVSLFVFNPILQLGVLLSQFVEQVLVKSNHLPRFFLFLLQLFVLMLKLILELSRLCHLLLEVVDRILELGSLFNELGVLCLAVVYLGFQDSVLVKERGTLVRASLQ